MDKYITKLPCAVFAYVHHNGKCGAIVSVESETDFALRTDLVKDIGPKLAMHAVAFGGLNPNTNWLMDQTKTVASIIGDISKELGESFCIKDVKILS